MYRFRFFVRKQKSVLSMCLSKFYYFFKYLKEINSSRFLEIQYDNILLDTFYTRISSL